MVALLKSVYLHCVAGGHHILLRQKTTIFQRSHRDYSRPKGVKIRCVLWPQHFVLQDRSILLSLLLQMNTDAAPHCYAVGGGSNILLWQKITTFRCGRRPQHFRGHRLLTVRGRHGLLCPLATAVQHFKSQDRSMALLCCD